MTIADELQHYNDGLIDAYDAVDAKGGIIPQNKNLDNLPTAIGSISGGGGGGALDPEEVYRQTRPADWLKMPEIGENEDNVIYMLIQIDSTTTEDVPFGHQANTYGGTWNQSEVIWEFGTTDSAGNFVADPSLTETVVITATTNFYASCYKNIPASAFSAQTSDGKKQLMCKVHTTDTVYFRASIEAGQVPYRMRMTTQVVEIKLKATSNVAKLEFRSPSSSFYSALRYFNMVGDNAITDGSSFFESSRALVCVLHLDTSNMTTMSSMFSNCSSLVAIPELDTSNSTIFRSMFDNCYSLCGIPEIDVSKGTSCYRMFYGCSSLTSVPRLNTTEATDFQDMFRGCYALTSITALDTSKATTVYEIFQGCNSLTSIPALDTSNVTNFSYMFSGCNSLASIPTLNTSKGTNFQSMFGACSSLTSIPQINTSKGTDLKYMFSGCSALSNLDFTWLDTTLATGASSINSIWGNVVFGGKVLEIGDKWPASGIVNTSSLLSSTYTLSSLPAGVKINKTDAMLPIAVNATTLFTNDQYLYVYVPDALLATYQADTYWATLGTRLKGFSELPS